jgi:sulfur carrier protein
MILIQLNGSEKILKKPLTIHELLKESKISHQAIAVAVNSEIVPRSDFEKIKIRNHDEIEIIHAVGGG